MGALTLRRRALLTGAWSLVTGAAVALAWFGVHTVLAGTTYDPPRTLPVSERSEEPEVRPRSSSTQRPKPSPSRTARPDDARPSRDASPSRSPSERPGGTSPRPSGTGGSPTPPGSPPPDGGTAPTADPGVGIRAVAVRGGRVVLDLRATSASLVSATPQPGWQMRVWTSRELIRVTFTNGAQTSTVLCHWSASTPPRVQTIEN
ncbi:hypothetical protein E0L36_01680 [Streptomyces sp. AJS327]|uniref:hypothetical protein n=1 Tax=Streptomyces sp. AJS327 TaxID=2545265 RepID=UPI0015DFF849|nr:hypothetical protein [Streptomyces sp. AJS327]MBA0049659.1 hypothetical protein [Streptomyces sp. AJS327]